MGFKKFFVYLIITAFISNQVAWASGAPLKKDATAAKENGFSLNGQTWGSIEMPSRTIDDATFVIEHDDQKKFYKILAHAEEGLTLIDLLNDQKHHINIPAIKVSISKHCLFIVAPQGTTTGFHVIRLIDIEAFAFKTAIPSFFIPTDSSLGHVKEVVARHSDLTGEIQEESLLMKTDNPDSSVTEMSYQDVQEIIQIELIYLAMEQAIKHPGFKELDGLIASIKKDFESFYEDFYADLKAIGGEDATKLLTPQLKELNWESSTPEALAQALATTDDNSELMTLKLNYAKRLSNIILSFSESYESLMDKIDLSSVPITTADQAEAISSEGEESVKDKILNAPLDALNVTGQFFKDVGTELEDMGTPSNPEEGRQATLIIYESMAVLLFVTLVLPKMLKKPFSTMAGEYSAWHYRILNKSWLRAIVNKINPEYLKTSESAFAKVVNKLGPQEKKFLGIIGTGDQWRRSFAQVSADTLTVIGAEVLARPLFQGWKSPGELLFGWDPSPSDQAIFINEPFDEKHSIWVQKNVIYHVLSNQIIGTIGNVAQLGVIEKQYNDIVANYLKNTDLEVALKLQELPINEQEKVRRKIATTIGDDLKKLEKEIAVRAKQKLAAGAAQTLTVESLEIRGALKELVVKWAGDLEKIGGSGHKLSQGELLGICKATLFGMAIKSSMTVVFGERFAQGTANLAKKSWDNWIYIFEPGFWNGIVMQTAFRSGSWSPSYFIFNRLVSLFFLCPFYIGTYEAAKNRFGLHSSKAEFAYGLAYGLVTSTVYNYLFVYGYEKPVKGTMFDIEIPILKYLVGAKDAVKNTIIGEKKERNE
ncbi:MAG: hypothetical protein HYW85_03180 [Deltaproteobacteria bacterium]|nr:hypothetical protein [Deltaproteobacteria bacterium]